MPCALTRPSCPCPFPPPLPAAASNQTWYVSKRAYCNMPNDTVLCVPPAVLQPVDSDPFGISTVEDLLSMEQYKAVREDPTNLSVLGHHPWGTCMERGEALQRASVPECGEPGGPCGPALCGVANRTCPEG